MEQIVIAELNESAHADAILYLLNVYAQDPMGGGAPLSEFVQHNLISELQKRPNIHIVLAFSQQQPVGMALCIEGFSSFTCQPLLNIHDIVVVPEYRGQGLAKRILTQAETIARELGCCKLTLEVLEGNQPAQQAYKSFGFAGYELDPQMGKALFWQKKLS